jgi:tetratricopeptide (TPR) repeat protein
MTILSADDVAFALVRARHDGGAHRVLPSLIQAADGVMSSEGVARAQILGAAAEVLDEAGRSAEALEMFRRGFAAADTYLDKQHLRLGLADCLVSAGHFEEADVVLDEVLDQRIPEDLAFPLRIIVAASAFAHAGDPERAMKYLDRAMDLAGPDVPRQLLTQRRAVRGVVGLDEDAADREAARHAREIDQQRPSNQLREAGRPLAAWWPRPEYDRLTRQLPQIAERAGRSWEEHRRQVQIRLLDAHQAGRRPVLCRQTADMLLAYLLATKAQIDAETAAKFADFAADLGAYTELPKPRQPCWCESGNHYKSCCATL